MTRVLHAYKVYKPEMEGGIPEVISNLVRDTEVESEIFVARTVGRSRSFLFDGIKVTATASLGVLSSMPISFPFVFRISRAMKSADIVVHHYPFPLVDLALLLFLPKRVTLVVYWHADILGRSVMKQLLSPLISATLKRSDRIVVSDDSIIDRSQQLHPYRDKCESIPYGLNLEIWSDVSEDENAAIARLKNERPRLIVAVGRLVPYKGLNILIKAMQTIDGHAAIIGSGPESERLGKLIEELDVGHKVTLMGKLTRSEMKVYLHASKVFAFPSVTEAEAFGIAQVEAMRVGLPIVNTQLATAVPKIARHGTEGLTVQPGNAVELSGAINRLLDNAALATKFGKAAKDRAVTEYSLASYHQKIRRVYKRAQTHRAKRAD